MGFNHLFPLSQQHESLILLNMEFTIQDIFRRNPFGVMKLPNLHKTVVETLQSKLHSWCPNQTKRCIISTILIIIFLTRIILLQRFYFLVILLLLHHVYLLYIFFNSKIDSIVNGPKLPVHHDQVFYPPPSQTAQPSSEELGLQIWFSSLKSSLGALACSFCGFLDPPFLLSATITYFIVMVWLARNLLAKPNARKRLRIQMDNFIKGPTKFYSWGGN